MRGWGAARWVVEINAYLAYLRIASLVWAREITRIDGSLVTDAIELGGQIGAYRFRRVVYLSLLNDGEAMAQFIRGQTVETLLDMIETAPPFPNVDNG